MSCEICHQPITDGRLIESETGLAYHPACVVERLPQDVAVAVGALLTVVLAPVIVWWAG